MCHTEIIMKFVNAKLKMKELKCERCGDLYVQGHLTGTDELCELCREETIEDEEPDMSGADGENSGER
jgi:formylmethanofuran dehydrogenase subunit E